MSSVDRRVDCDAIYLDWEQLGKGNNIHVETSPLTARIHQVTVFVCRLTIPSTRRHAQESGCLSISAYYHVTRYGPLRDNGEILQVQEIGMII